MLRVARQLHSSCTISSEICQTVHLCSLKPRHLGGLESPMSILQIVFQGNGCQWKEKKAEIHNAASLGRIVSIIYMYSTHADVLIVYIYI